MSRDPASVFLDGGAGRLRLYLAGDLQLDEADERLYHEPLALVPTALAAARAPGRPLRVLVLGGGDGLAVREVLRVPGVTEVRLVDRDPAVVALGRGALSRLNRRALHDARVRVELRDARDVLPDARDFDVVVFDLTYPGDADGAALLTIDTLGQAGAALAPHGILALNAVSPELTPDAFGCLAATLEAAGFRARPYAFDLPSFRAEGYGRWGFLYGGRRPIGAAEIRRLRLPAGSTVTAAALLEGARLPVSAPAAWRAGPNRTDELVSHLRQATAVAWTPPFRPVRFGARAGRRGPRATARAGFARWLRRPPGRRTLEELLRCLPLGHRGPARGLALTWAPHAERLFQAVDPRAFVDGLLSRAARLPRAWVREIRAVRVRLADGLPPLRDCLEQSYRVFAVLLLVLLLANLLFPDNLYAKGSSSSSRSSSSGSGSSVEEFKGFQFTDPTVRFAPFRARGPVAPGRVLDRHGQALAAVTMAAGPGGPGLALLALTAELQLLDSGRLAYVPPVPGFLFVLEPGRLRVVEPGGEGGPPALDLLPGALDDEARVQLDAQVPLLDRALLDHRRWLDWVAWGAATSPGREAQSELARLASLRQAVETARERWRQARAPLVLPRAGWEAVFPGIFLDPAPGVPGLVLVTPAGEVRPRSLEPPARLEPADRFLFRLLWPRQDPVLREALAGWVTAHGEAAFGLGPRPPRSGS